MIGSKRCERANNIAELWQSEGGQSEKNREIFIIGDSLVINVQRTHLFIQGQTLTLGKKTATDVLGNQKKALITI